MSMSVVILPVYILLHHLWSNSQCVISTETLMLVIYAGFHLAIMDLSSGTVTVHGFFIY